MLLTYATLPGLDKRPRRAVPDALIVGIQLLPGISPPRCRILAAGFRRRVQVAKVFMVDYARALPG